MGLVYVASMWKIRAAVALACLSLWNEINQFNTNKHHSFQHVYQMLKEVFDNLSWQ